MDFKPDKIYHGVAYYPELWPAGDIGRDIEIMRKYGINVVRMGEFSWAMLEPEKDSFNIGIFDKVIARLGESGIETILGTPTATPPRWFTKENPGSVYVDKNMIKANHGSREHVCFNSPEYIERSRIIVEKMAKHYGNNKYVIAWQIHNEYNCPPVNECVCDNCMKEWHKWLKNKYGDIEILNKKWGTGVWSTRYNSFEDVVLPRPTPNGHSASLTTNYTMFCFDSVARYNKMQADILKKYVKAPITHNTNRFFHINQESIFAPLDFVAYDDYSIQENYEETVFAAELCRCLKPGVPFWEMETASSYSANLHGTSGYHKPGFVRAEAVNVFFAGGVGFSYWLFRQQRSGTEMPHGHLVTAWGAPSASLKNVEEVSEVIAQLQPFLLSTRPLQAPIALMYSDKARAFALSETLAGNNYPKDILSFYSSLLKAGVYRDIVYEGGDLSGYKFIIVPYIMNIGEKLRRKILGCVKNGATVLIGPYSGWRTEDHTYYTDRAFGKLEKYFGKEIEDISFFQGQEAVYSLFGEKHALVSTGCVVSDGIGRIEGGCYDGKSLICENNSGKGKIIFLGARLEKEQQDKFIKETAGTLVKPLAEPCEGIIPYERGDEKHKYYCYVNISRGKKKLRFKKMIVDLFTGRKSDEFDMRAGDYVVVKTDLA